MKHLDFYSGRTGNRLFQMAYLYAQMREGKIPDWYVQDYRHFEKYLDELRGMFSDGIGYLPYVAMHIRRGKNPVNPDEPAYSENSFYVNLMKTKYYANAIDHFVGRRFLIFSDDMEFAKKNFQGEIFAYDESENDIEAFNKFASCESHIIANSSWSYWGALLSPKHGGVDKKVVAPNPKLWYNDGNEVRTVCPPHWIFINE